MLIARFNPLVPAAVLALSATFTSLGCAGAEEADGSSAGQLALGPGFHLEVGVEADRSAEGALLEGHPSTTNMYSLAQVNDVMEFTTDPKTVTERLCTLGIRTKGVACKGAGPFVDGEVTFFDTDSDDHAIYVATTVPSAAGPKDVGILAIRGTYSIRNVFTDADVTREENWGPDPDHVKFPGTVHNGFNKSMRRLWEGEKSPPLGDFIRERHAGAAGAGRPLYVTGYSLGAGLVTTALAYLLFGECTEMASGEHFALPRSADKGDLAWTLKGTSCPKTSDLNIAALYTYGSPRVGNGDFADALANLMALRRIAHFRLVHGNDLVSRIAPRSTGYSHLHVTLQGLKGRRAGEAKDRTYSLVEDEEAKVLRGDEERMADCRQWDDDPAALPACPIRSLAYLARDTRDVNRLLRIGVGASEALDENASLPPSVFHHLLNRYLEPLAVLVGRK